MESIIIETAKKIHSLGSEVDIIFQNKNKLVFPTQSQPKKGDKKRISEQELRQCFIDIIKEKDDLFYSIETPTKEKYRFTGTNDLSGNLDLCIYNLVNNKLERVNCIEFKAHNMESTYINDIKKLTKEKGTNLYFHLLGAVNKSTLTSEKSPKRKGLLVKLKDDLSSVITNNQFNASSITFAIISLSPFFLIYQTILKEDTKDLAKINEIKMLDYTILNKSITFKKKFSWKTYN